MGGWIAQVSHKGLVLWLAVLILAATTACSMETGPMEPVAPAAATAQPVKTMLQASAPVAVGTATPVPDAGTFTTKVVVYYPVDFGGDARTGSCLTNSLAVLSRDAWRCSVSGDSKVANNAAPELFDPCFDLGTGKVLCNPNPLTGQRGILVGLSEPLPTPNLIVEKPSNPWLLELDDGLVCARATGATGVVNAKRINYLCSTSLSNSRSPEKIAVLGEPSPGVTWTAEKAVVAMREGKLVSTSSSTVPLRTVVKGPPQRVLFESGTTAASFQRTIQAGDSHDFVLWAFMGQTMIVDATASRGEVSLSVVGRSTGQELAPGGNAKRWQVKLPETQDYRIRVTAPGGAADYQLGITIPASLSIPSGAHSTTVKGRVKPGQKVLYLLPGMAEQRVAVNVASPDGKALLAVYGLGDGASLVPAVAKTRVWDGVLPQEQDYVIEVGSEGSASDYTLQISTP